MADEQFAPAGSALKLGLKDVRLVLETAQECAAPMPLASMIRDHLLAAGAQRGAFSRLWRLAIFVSSPSQIRGGTDDRFLSSVAAGFQPALSRWVQVCAPGTRRL